MVPQATANASLPPAAEGAGRPFAEDPDWALIERIGRGDQGALAQLYRRHHDRLRRFVHRITKDESGLDDIVNETMLVVWDKAAVTTPQSRVSTWILGIAYRKALKTAERTRRVQHDDYDEMDESIAAEDTGQQHLEADEVAAAALARLPPEQRAVMELVYHDGMAYADIATLLQCPENTVKTRIFHARRRLRALWHELTGVPASASA